MILNQRHEIRQDTCQYFLLDDLCSSKHNTSLMVTPTATLNPTRNNFSFYADDSHTEVSYMKWFTMLLQSTHWWWRRRWRWWCQRSKWEIKPSIRCIHLCRARIILLHPRWTNRRNRRCCQLLVPWICWSVGLQVHQRTRR